MKNFYLSFLLILPLFTLRAQVFAGGNGDGGANEQYSGAVQLPLTLLSFTAAPKGATYQLRWTTVDEIDTDFFTVQRSRDGLAFVEVGKLPAAGYSKEVRDYSFVDDQPLPGRFFYRLKVTDYDGSFSLSDLITVTDRQISESTALSIAPHPVVGIHFELKLPPRYQRNTNLMLRLYTALGRQVHQWTYEKNTSKQLPVELPHYLASGSYILQLESVSGGGLSERLLIAR